MQQKIALHALSTQQLTSHHRLYLTLVRQKPTPNFQMKLRLLPMESARHMAIDPKTQFALIIKLMNLNIQISSKICIFLIKSISRYLSTVVESANNSDAVSQVESSDQSCLSDYKFIAITEEKDMIHMVSSGVLGLAPSSQRSNSKMFISELYNAGIIKQKVFSMKLDLASNSSNTSY